MLPRGLPRACIAKFPQSRIGSHLRLLALGSIHPTIPTILAVLATLRAARAVNKSSMPTSPSRWLLLMLPTMACAVSGFASRHLILQGCSEKAPKDNPSYYVDFWLMLLSAFKEGFEQDGAPFDSIDCVLNKVEEAAVVARIAAEVQQRGSGAHQSLIVAGLLQPGHCYSPTDDANECPGTSNDFSTYEASLTLDNSIVHLWIEVGPNVSALGLGPNNVTSFTVSPNNYDGGRMAGTEYCLRAANSRPQRILAIYGPPSAQHSTDRIDGFDSALHEYCPQHRILYREYAHWSRTTAAEKAASAFLSDSNIGTVVCANDIMAMGVIEAAKEARPTRENGLLITGYDHTVDIRAPLAAGIVPVTIDQLASLTNDGLIFTSRGMAKQLDRWLQTSGKPLTNNEAIALLGLDRPAIMSRVMPVVSNMRDLVARKLMTAYDKATRPFSHFLDKNVSGACARVSAPTKVETQFYMTQLYNVDQKTGSYQVDGYFRLWWTDKRLAYDMHVPNVCLENITFSPSEVWTPDIYFEGSNSDYQFAPGGAQPTASSITVSREGRIFWTRQARLKMQCTMNFTELPFDTQRCPFSVGTWSQTAEEVTLKWMDPKDPFPEWDSPNISAPPWSVIGVHANEVVEEFGAASSEYSSAVGVFYIRRDWRAYSQDILLAMVMVAASYSGCWVLDWQGAGLHLFVILIVVTQRQQVMNQLPPGVSGTWLDDFLFGCFVFSLIAFVVSAVQAFAIRVIHLDEAAKESRELAESRADAKRTSLMLKSMKNLRMFRSQKLQRAPSTIPSVCETVSQTTADVSHIDIAPASAHPSPPANASRVVTIHSSSTNGSKAPDKDSTPGEQESTQPASARCWNNVFLPMCHGLLWVEPCMRVIYPIAFVIYLAMKNSNRPL